MFQLIAKYQNNHWFCLTGIFIAVCFVMLPLALTGIPLGTDLNQHLQFASTYHNAILSGDFFPGWAASDNFGFGSAGIRIYPPVAYYLMAFSQMITGNWYDTFWTNAFFWMFVGSIGMYLWSKEWLSPLESAVVAVFYAFVPYHRFQIYQFVLFAEFAAAGILPFCFFTITRLVRRGKPIDVILFAISFALLILTHIPTTILGTLGMGIYVLSLMEWKNWQKIFAKLFIGGSLALLASAFHWIRLVSEMEWVKHTAQNYTVDFYDYKNHLFPLVYSVDDPFFPPMNPAIIMLMLSLLPSAVYVLIRFKIKWDTQAEKKIAVALLLTGSVCLFMSTYASLFIWENFTFIQKVQFPFRWLSIVSLVAPFALVFGISRLYKTFQNSNRSRLILAALLFSLIFVPYLAKTTRSFLALNRDDFATETKGLEEKRGCPCWRPSWSSPDAFKNKEKVQTDSRNFTINKWESESREFQIEPGASQKIRIATFYYPLWKATINNQAVELTPSETGMLSLSVPAEKSEVKIYFQEPQFVSNALFISGFAWISLFGALVFFQTRRNQKQL